MPTADDLIAIESMKSLAANLRGYGKSVAEGEIGAAGIAQRGMDRQLKKDLLKSQLFAAQEAAEKSRNFREKESDKRMASAEKIAGIRSGKDTHTINVTNIIAEDDKTTTEDVVESGLLKTEEGPDGSLVVTGLQETSESQAKMLKKLIINANSMTDEAFNSPERIVNHNKNFQKLIDKALKDNKSPNSGLVRALKVMQIPKGATKEVYKKNMASYWRALVKQEVGRRTKIQQGRTTGQAPTPSAYGASIQHTPKPGNVSDHILGNVLDLFGGDLPE